MEDFDAHHLLIRPDFVPGQAAFTVWSHHALRNHLWAMALSFIHQLIFMQAICESQSSVVAISSRGVRWRMLEPQVKFQYGIPQNSPWSSSTMHTHFVLLLHRKSVFILRAKCETGKEPANGQGVVDSTQCMGGPGVCQHIRESDHCVCIYSFAPHDVSSLHFQFASSTTRFETIIACWR